MHATPLYRSLEPDITTSDEEVDEPKVPTKTKLFVVKSRNNDADEGRFFKHILLYRSLLQPQSNYPGFTMPYLIINNPTNLTNINNNTLNNVPAAVAAVPPAAGGGVRIAYIPDSQALPYPMPMPTQVYQQRQQPLAQVVYRLPLSSGNENVRRRNRFGNGNGNNNNEHYYQSSDTIPKNNLFSTFANSWRRVQFF